MSDKPILVTGALGNVGRGVVAGLLHQGLAVRTADISVAALGDAYGAEVEPVTEPDDDLQAIDSALLGLRRMWAHSGTFSDPDLGELDLSTVLVVHEVAAASAASISEVAAGLDVTHSTASRLVDRAARVGVISRSVSESDGRRTVVTLTPAGQRLQSRATGFRTAYLATLMRSWTPGQCHAFATLLTQFAETVRSTPHPEAPDEDRRDWRHRPNRAVPGAATASGRP